MLKVFQCGKFPVDDEKIQAYLNPPLETVDEVLLSPVKRTVSVKGILRRSSDIIESPNSKRRELVLESTEGSSSVVCKLWGEASSVDIPPEGAILTATSMQVATWKGGITLNSSVLTVIQETEEESCFDGEIEGIEVLPDFSYMIVREKTMKIKTADLERILNGVVFQENIFVKGRCKGMTVLEIQQCNPAKKVKE
uniref:Uncharacterized protein LOC111137227 isoform X2 n=1 Tax=Crassostrea virginica TaxID=6565 RepID=A0A8B8EWB7_CRAVI|nr:uncharacterized protein LOC111137227 isoform X2 [Crassostrea virginica]